MSHHYFVVSPEMSEVVPVLDTGEGPTEYFRCVASVEAANKQDAKVLALRTKEMSDWVTECRSDGVNPFAGLEVRNAICPHGFCFCDGCDPEACEACFNSGPEIEVNMV